MQLNQSLASAASLKASADSNLKLAQQRRDKAGEDLDLFVASQTSLIEAQERELASFRAELSLSGGNGTGDDVESVKKQLQTATAARTVAEEKHQRAANELRNARSAVEQLNKKISEAALERKNLEGIMRYRAACAELIQKQSELAVKTAELNSVGSSEQLAALEKDQKDLQALTAKVERLRGHRDTLKAQKVDFESKIKRAEPKKVNNDLAEKIAELEATKMAIKDVENYYNALDQALMK